MKKLLLITVMFLSACTKIANTPIPSTAIDLGVKSTSTAISNLTQNNNIVTVEFSVTQGSKYSVQITPFNSFTPIVKDGFTATSSSVIKTYDLSKIAKSDYNLIFIDIDGNETKRPIIIK